MGNKEQHIAAIREFNRFYTNIIGIVNQHYLQSALSLSEVRVLYEINYNKACTAKSIKELLQIDEGYLSRILERFAKKGIVKKLQSPDDGRAWLLSLTAKGRKLFAGLENDADNAVSKIITGLSVADLEEITGMMTSIRRLLSKQDTSYEKI